MKIIEDVTEPSGFYSNASEDFFRQPLKGLSRTLKANQHDSCVVEPIAFDEQNKCLRYDGTVGTLTTDGSTPKHNNRVVEPCICASRGRNPDNPSDRTTGADTEQRLEINEQGTGNTLTSVQKDNYVVEPSIIQNSHGFNKGAELSLCPTITSSSFEHNNFLKEPKLVSEPLNAEDDGTCRTIKSQYGKTSKANFERTTSYGTTGVIEKPTYRIRKLTAKECMRLMNFDDEDYQKIKAIGMSDSQIYKQCGNSIVVRCLEKLFDKMFIHTEITEPKQLSLFD